MDEKFLGATIAAIVLVLLSGCPSVFPSVSSINFTGQPCGGVQGIPCREGYECEVEQTEEMITDQFGKCVPYTTPELENASQPPAQNASKKLCEIGESYELSASKDVECVCPEGYELGYEIIGYSHEGGVESPILGVTCVPK